MGNMHRVDRVLSTVRRRPDQWLRVLLIGVVVIGILPPVAFAEISDNLTEIPVGPGQVCIKYITGYSSLADWSSNSPAEMGKYQYISYDGVEYAHTVHSCVGGSTYPGSLPTGNFLLLLGGLIRQAALVNIERISNKCPYMLTYYRLTNPVKIADPSGTCVKGSPPDKIKNQGQPNTCQ
jgi:hypothetical protein